MRYRPEIDGLRAVAVGSVLIYHAKFSFWGEEVLNGGFLGVDIFFVISGFLITSLILIEKRSMGRFSVLHFYDRRARRLLPALFVVIFASWPVAWAILMPSEMVDFVKSQIASVFFLSNMYWWEESLVYGARSGLFEPFLHTWSLAVEEQFYIIFPLVYLTTLRFIKRDAILIGLGAVGVLCSLTFAQYATMKDPNLSFYWLPSRVWELLAGAVLAHLLYVAPEFGRRPLALRLLPPVGFLLILVPMWTMDLSWSHPGFGTVASVLGTILIIWFSSPKDIVTRLLSSKAFLAVGLISYSLYLWHYPIFAFGRMIQADPSSASKAVWITLSFILAVLSYRYVEQRFRHARSMPLRRFALSGVASVVLICGFATAMIVTDGFRARLSGLIAMYGHNEFDNEALRVRSWASLSQMASAELPTFTGRFASAEHEAEFLWFDDGADVHNVLIIGDSHSKDMFNVFSLNADKFPNLAFARFGITPSLDDGAVQRFLSSPNFEAADTIALSFRFNAGYLFAFPKFIERIKAEGKNVVLFLSTVEFNDIENKPVFDWFIQNSGSGFDAEAINRLAWAERNLEGVLATNEALTQLAADTDILALDKSDFICDVEAQTCDAVTSDGYKSFYDYGHYTPEGARHFGRVISETGWFVVPSLQNHGH